MMQPDDGRVVTNFIVRALRGECWFSTATVAKREASNSSTTWIEGIVRLMGVSYFAPG